MNKLLTRGAVAAAFAVLSGTAVHAAFGDFTVDQTSITVGNTPVLLGLAIGQPTFQADKVTGFYQEVLTITSSGDPANNPFVSNAYAYMNLFSRNEGTNPAIGSLAGVGYNLYATFSASGSYNLTNNTFTGATGLLNFYLDPLLNTTLALGASGSDPVAVGSAADDYLLGTATNLTFATGNNVQPGSYQIIWDDFTLTTPDGKEFFIAPDPFYMVVDVTGDFDVFPVVFDPAGTATVRTTGDVSAVFSNVPEPATLALVGLSLCGLALSRRRRT